jgi:hypothetical protein
VVYAIHIEQLEADVRGERQIAAMLAAAGAPDVHLPTMAEQRDLFDKALAEAPEQESDSMREWRQAMGLT